MRKLAIAVALASTAIATPALADGLVEQDVVGFAGIQLQPVSLRLGEFVAHQADGRLLADLDQRSRGDIPDALFFAVVVIGVLSSPHWAATVHYPTLSGER